MNEDLMDKILRKAKELIKKAGETALRKALELGEVLKADGVPVRVKGTIVGALTYVLLPVDSVPDFMPGVGYADDITALTVCYNAVSGYISQDMKVRASRKFDEVMARLRSWFA